MIAPDLRVGVDIGGTFTDVVVSSDDGTRLIWKEDTTPHQPDLAIQRGLANAAAQLGLDLKTFLSRLSLFVHGSTIATNMVIQRSGAPVGLICTRGFRDALYFRNGFKWDRFNPRLARPDDLVPRRLRIGVAERIGPDGTVRQPLDEEGVRAAARRLRADGVEAVAVACLWSQVNPVHERRVLELLEEEIPDVPVLLSADILPELGEWIRTSATVLSAYVYAGSRDYLTRLEDWLRQEGMAAPLLIMHVNGGCATVEQTLKLPVATIHSGPAAAPAAAGWIGRRLSARNMITIDMGGTSFDVCLIHDGEVPRSRSIEVAHQPIGIPGVEIHSIGAGGGSIAWIDAGGALRVGPRSAGAHPGPAAYGRGGEQPTVTDANVVLGYLSPEAFLGGRRKLRLDLAAEAIRNHIGEPLGIDVETAAAGVIRIVNQNMVDAISVVSVERGIDPRPFLLVVGGGAGALHAAALARELGIAQVVIPAEAGVLSAYGMTVTDVRHDYVATLHATTLDADLDAIEGAIDSLERRARRDLERSGFSDGQALLRRSVDARYVDQVHELMVPVPEGPVSTATLLDIGEAFHRLHERRYGWADMERAVECLHWRVTGVGRIGAQSEAAFEQLPAAPVDDALAGTRSAWFDELDGFAVASVYEGEHIKPGGALEGPAIVELPTTTIVVPPRQQLRGDGRGTFLLRAVED